MEDIFVIWRLPIKTISESNSCENYFVKAKRHRLQKQRIFHQFLFESRPFSLPCKVILTRIAPRKLDEGDNLPCSLKYIRDAVSEKLTGIVQAGRADNDSRIVWEYRQEKGSPKEYGVQIEIICENNERKNI